MGLGDRGRLGGTHSPSWSAAKKAGTVARPNPKSVRKLKPGPGLTPDVVFADQRRRLRVAAIDLISDGGYHSVTVRALSQTAGVSTRTFYRQFANVADCAGFAGESTMLEALQHMRAATAAARSPDDGVNAALGSLMRYVASNPEAVCVALIDAFDAGAPVLQRVRSVTRTIEGNLSDLLSTLSAPTVVPDQLVIGMVAGVLRIARATAVAGRAAELPRMASELSAWVLSLAVLSGDEARRPSALTRPAANLSRDQEPMSNRRLGDDASGRDDHERLLRATVRLAAADGLPGLTIPQIRRAAGVSRQSFNHYFTSVPECFLASIQWLVEAAAARARAWAAPEPDRDRRIGKCSLALCAQAARNVPLARLALLEVMDAGRDGLLCRDSLLEAGVKGIRRELALSKSTGEIALQASFAAAWEIAAAEVTAGQTSRLPALSALLAAILLAPTRPLEGRPSKR